MKNGVQKNQKKLKKKNTFQVLGFDPAGFVKLFDEHLPQYKIKCKLNEVH